jgi:predicted P-loop ATPase
LPKWLHAYLGAAQSDYSKDIGIMFLIGMVARVLRPGSKMDYMLVLEGEQGTFKSSACAVLAGDYFSDHLPNLSNKDASLHLRGKWLVEVAELRAYSRAAIDEFKEFLVREIDRYRPPWGRKDVHEPRQCVFIGTTNKLHYLRDETGNRRSWPVKTGTIDLDSLRRDRDQLFAEAVWRFKEGERWWPDGEFERTKIADEQEARFDPDIWEPLIEQFLKGRDRTTLMEIAVGTLDYEPVRPGMVVHSGEPQPIRKTPINRLGTADQRRITGILTHLGWEPSRDKRGRWWEPKKPER